MICSPFIDSTIYPHTQAVPWLRLPLSSLCAHYLAGVGASWEAKPAITGIRDHSANITCLGVRLRILHTRHRRTLGGLNTEQKR